MSQFCTIYKKVDFFHLPNPLLLLFALFWGKQAFFQKCDKKSSDLIGRELSRINLENENFPRYGICAETIIHFILGHFQQKNNDSILRKSPKTLFLPFLGPFTLNRENENFPRHGIFAESQPTILVYFQQKLMTQFFVNVQKPYFWAFLGPFSIFWKNEIFPKNWAWIPNFMQNI